ncbi:hypothetical protein NQ314_012194 [Rhamnusium bicolor]|uniref:Uncharacterized protein n=1 Tax=Rhamnusium bicolor TaxID=1586634 RepID=A0AAV8XCQ6_9CUCU|nr:hypothetical protein NQ314_012194 [Rhamnusium bicolor]
MGSHTISKSQEVTKTKKIAELREILNNVSECLSIANEDKLQYAEKTLKVLYNYMCTGTRKDRRLHYKKCKIVQNEN